MGRIESEKRTVKVMIEIYCKKKHKNKEGLCPECQELLDYANKRLSLCSFGENKSTCGKCKIHCYNKEMRARIKDVMRFSGPRMIIYCPKELIKHALGK